MTERRLAPATRRNLRIAHANMADATDRKLADGFVRESIYTTATAADVARARPLTELRTLRESGRTPRVGDVLALEITAKLGMFLEEGR